MQLDSFSLVLEARRLLCYKNEHALCRNSLKSHSSFPCFENFLVHRFLHSQSSTDVSSITISVILLHKDVSQYLGNCLCPGVTVRLLSRLVFYRGLQVSPLCLGTMSFGNAWSVDPVDPPERLIEALKPLAGKVQWRMQQIDYLSDPRLVIRTGRNSLDLANIYQDDESEQWAGEWLEERGVRDQMVLATEYTNN